MSSEEHQLEGASVGATSSVAAEEHDVSQDTLISLVELSADSLTSCQTIVADDSGIPETWTELQFSWSGKPFSLKVADSDRHVSMS